MRASILLLSLALSGLGGCTGPSARQTVTVFAAASLSESFRALEQAYEVAHPSVDIELSFAGSQLLAAQLLEGAPAQVFASADSIQVERVAEERELADRRVFASNRIVIVVPAGSAIQGISDLMKPGVRVVLAGEAVPAGHYARLTLERLPVDSIDVRAAVEQNLVSNENDVRGVVAKVRLGEADAGMAYATDVIGDAQLELREIGLTDVAARYELAVLADPKHPQRQAGAIAFAEFVTSPAGQAILAEHGFGPP